MPTLTLTLTPTLTLTRTQTVTLTQITMCNRMCILPTQRESKLFLSILSLLNKVLFIFGCALIERLSKIHIHGFLVVEEENWLHLQGYTYRSRS